MTNYDKNIAALAAANVPYEEVELRVLHVGAYIYWPTTNKWAKTDNPKIVYRGSVQKFINEIAGAEGAGGSLQKGT